MVAVDAYELDVRPLGEALVMLDERAEAQQLGAVGQPLDDGMRVPDRHRRELYLLAVHLDRLRRGHLDLAHPLLDFTLASQPCRDEPRPDQDAPLVGAGAAGEPACGDPRAVAGELRDRAVRVPDHDLGRVAVRRDDFQNPVRADAEVVVADALDRLRRQRSVELGLLDEQVVVAEPVPLGELHRATLPSRSTISCATSAGGWLPSSGTSPGIRRIHLRW